MERSIEFTASYSDVSVSIRGDLKYSSRANNSTGLKNN